MAVLISTKVKVQILEGYDSVLSAVYAPFFTCLKSLILGLSSPGKLFGSCPGCSLQLRRKTIRPNPQRGFHFHPAAIGR